MFKLIKFLITIFFLTSCQSNFNNKDTFSPLSVNLDLPFHKYQLDNGLTVVLHEDHSDPIVAFVTLVHAGSSRETLGKTGFAHFFEHMAFNDSENVPRGANRKMIEELGGKRNGGTWRDATYYYELVPKDALEKLMWINSDRLGYMINTVSQQALDIEKQVVKNEKRQRVDNQPYGHTNAVISRNLYPPSHPYHWTVLGELKDLQSATLEDVKEFYQKFYGPQNTTLVIAGDFQVEKIKPLIEKWYGEIKPLNKVTKLKPLSANLKQSKQIYHLDNFANVPELTLTFPTVPQYHPDSYALELLAQILGQGVRAPLFNEIVSRRNLASSVITQQTSNELAGTFSIQVRANKDTDLDLVHEAIQTAFRNFEKSTIDLRNLQSLKLTKEVNIYRNLQGVLDKAVQLGTSQLFTNDPTNIAREIEEIRAVSFKDIVRVYKYYIKDKPYLLTSFIPKGQLSLAVENSQQAIVNGEERSQSTSLANSDVIQVNFPKTQTKLDRKEPPLGDSISFETPEVKDQVLKNGLRILTIEHNELPLVEFKLRIDGSAWMEAKNKLGSAAVLANMLNESANTKNTYRIRNELGRLASDIRVTVDYTSINIHGSSLSKNFTKTLELASEMLLAPLFVESDFKRIKSRQQNFLKQLESDPFSIAQRSFNRQAYGENHRLSFPLAGTQHTLSKLTLDDVEEFYRNNISPRNSTLHVTGNITQQEVVDSARALFDHWQGEKKLLPVSAKQKILNKPKVFFVDIPDAKQSIIYVGKPALKGNNIDYYKFDVAQNRLGNGSSGQLFQTLRIDKGYTYGAYSQIEKKRYTAPFIAYSQVRTDVTLESLDTLRNLIRDYSNSYSLQDLITTKNQLQKKHFLNYETLTDLINLLDDTSRFGLSLDHFQQQLIELESISVKHVKKVFQQYANEQQMLYVVVGDAKTQLSRLTQFGYGDPIILDRNGCRLESGVCID